MRNSSANKVEQVAIRQESYLKSQKKIEHLKGVLEYQKIRFKVSSREIWCLIQANISWRV